MSKTGLNQNQHKKLIKQFGLNLVVTRKSPAVLGELVNNFKNPLILILLVVALISLFLGQMIDAMIVIVMVGLSVGLNFFQEHRASRAAEKLQAKVALECDVIRDGIEKIVKAESLVPGDLVILNAGDLIPADGKILTAKDFFLNQSVLTGESFPVEKTVEEIIYYGTNVVTGNAKMEVMATGLRTEYGKIVKAVDLDDEDNNFTRGIKEFSGFILRIVLIFVLFIFLVNGLIKHDFLESLSFAIAIAVGLTPEFLPMIMSITMANGALQMAKKKVIVKKLTAIPTFGSMDILCTDKTGTITQNKIELVRCVNIKGEESEIVFRTAYLNSWFQTGITNPLDQAIIQFKNLKITGYKKIDELPFDFDRKLMSVVIEKDGDREMITKGAPDAVFKKVAESLSSKEMEQVEKLYQNLSESGFRVLAIASRKITDRKKIYTKDDEVNLKFIGLAALLDPVKADVRVAIDRLEAAKIEIKVITGDNEWVAQKACQEAGVVIKGIIIGAEIDQLTEEELGIQAEKKTLFARFSPSQKSRVISALRARGHVVGYMGDGINDAPSLKSADVGISVSNAVDVAKETAEIILTHKSLMELIDGVIEGRKTFGNTMKYVLMGLSSNFGNMFSVLVAVIFLPFLPMLPIQILLNNFLYDLSQITIPTDNVDSEYLLEPKRWDIQLIRKFMVWFGPISSVFDLTTFVVMYWLFKGNAGVFQTGWFMESLATQTLVIHVIRTRKIPLLSSHASWLLILSTLTMVAVGWLIPYTSLGRLFLFQPLPIGTVIILTLIVGVYLLSAEFGKRLFYKNYQI